MGTVAPAWKRDSDMKTSSRYSKIFLLIAVAIYSLGTNGTKTILAAPLQEELPQKTLAGKAIPPGDCQKSVYEPVDFTICIDRGYTFKIQFNQFAPPNSKSSDTLPPNCAGYQCAALPLGTAATDKTYCLRHNKKLIFWSAYGFNRYYNKLYYKEYKMTGGFGPSLAYIPQNPDYHDQIDVNNWNNAPGNNRNIILWGGAFKFDENGVIFKRWRNPDNPNGDWRAIGTIVEFYKDGAKCKTT